MMNRFIPTNLTSSFYLKNIIQISAGGFHSLLLNNFGNVYSIGRNDVNIFLFNIEWTAWPWRYQR